jgi:hypothetical protein
MGLHFTANENCTHTAGVAEESGGGAAEEVKEGGAEGEEGEEKATGDEDNEEGGHRPTAEGEIDEGVPQKSSTALASTTRSRVGASERTAQEEEDRLVSLKEAVHLHGLVVSLPELPKPTVADCGSYTVASSSSVQVSSE